MIAITDEPLARRVHNDGTQTRECAGLRDAILTTLRAEGWLSRADLCLVLGIRPSRRTTVFDHLVALEATGDVRRIPLHHPCKGRPQVLWGAIP